MRLTSDFFVSALVRRVFGEGGFAAVSKKGAHEAGAIFILVDRLDRTFDLYGPAPQAFFDVMQQGGRQFEKILSCSEKEAVMTRLASEDRMDPDYWLVEIEARDGAVDLPVVTDEPKDKPADPFL
ncbi:DUF1491 family protein [Roseibium sediminis]|uniref:DUF1491 family protein n=1 Tax=Roseibium sediminis TaxID=1775174 RepID=UPI00123D5590|nr:DUF1491 family protein [Roseibium sediminis]